MRQLWSASVRTGTALVTALVAVTGGGGAAYAASPAPPTAPPPGSAGESGPVSASRTVTLVTGDRVTVMPSGAFTVERGPGRAGIDFSTNRRGGHLRVVPRDAAALLRSGRLDARLFDVTALLDAGYDDQRGDLPLIVGTGTGTAAVEKARAKVAGDETATIRTMPAVRAVTFGEKRAAASTFWQRLTAGEPSGRTLAPEISAVWLDGVRRPLLDRSVPQIGAPAAWKAGYTGKGVTVAVLDTGIDASHPDLAGRVAATHNFTEGLGKEDDADHVGHGTHVASTIAGSGAASQGRYRGVAPDARLADGKVCGARGCQDSWILAGMQWAAADQHAAVVNMSLGEADAPETDPLEQAVETLTAQYGTLFVVAAGNDGMDGSVGSPGSAPSALTVGSVDKDDSLSYFSSRGPRVGDDGLKPDVTAPGGDIVAARSKDSDLEGDSYTTMSGTSMATPHVAGAVALLAQQHPDWKAAQLKAALMASAAPNPAIGVFGQGAGRIDVARALTTSVVAQPPSVSLGRPHYPHDDDEAVSKQVTYHNGGSAPVTLTLTLDTTTSTTADAAGKPAPAGMLTVSPSTVTVPAGGDVAVTVTADTKIAGPDGYVGGELTATGGDVTVRTPVGVNREVESYDVTFTHLARTGAATGDYLTVLSSADGSRTFYAYPSKTGVTTLRVPKGNYLLDALLFDPVAGEPDETTPSVVSYLVQPSFDVTADRKVTLDARAAKPVTIDVAVPEGKSVAAMIGVGWARGTGGSETMTGFLAAGTTRLFTGHLGAPGPEDFRTMLSSVRGTPAADGTVSGARFTVSLGWFHARQMFDGLTRRLTTHDLAVVRARQAATMTGSVGGGGASPIQPGGGSFIGGTLPAPLPGTRTEYYNTEGGIRWVPVMQESSADEKVHNSVESPEVRYEPGRRYDVTRNLGVFGPTVALPADWGVGVRRTGDTLSVWVPLFGDGAGHPGSSSVTSAETTLAADGVTVGTTTRPASGGFTLPAGARQLRLTASARRPAPFTVSTQVTAAWTFGAGTSSPAGSPGSSPAASGSGTAAPGAGDAATVLPVWAVGFSPQLDDTNRTAAGRTLVVPVRAEAQPGAKAGTLSKLTVEVSFDDGATWTALPVRTAHGQATVSVTHPSGSGFVSLRASAADSDGNTVDETIVRAYGYGR